MKRSVKLIVIIASMLPTGLFGQYLTSARGVGLGAYTALVNDVSGLDWNPAGLIAVRDWELSESNYLSTQPNAGARGLLQSIAGSKRFLDNHAFSLRYSPGLAMQFIVPSYVQFQSGQPVSFDKKISYQEAYALGYGYQMSPDLSVGVSARLRQESITDTEYFIEQDTIARIRNLDYNASSWNVDVGLQWIPQPDFTMGIVAKNLFNINESQFPEEVRSLAFRTIKTVRVGVSYRPFSAGVFALDFDTQRQGGFGSEWNLFGNFKLRQGTIFGARYSPFFAAVSGGVGWAYQSIRFDLSYLHFFDGSRRQPATLQEFVDEGVKDIGFNQFTNDQVMLTLNVPLGRTREVLAKIEGVTITSDVYPSAYQVFASRPIGRARVRNVSQRPIEARVSFYVDQYMDQPTETQPIYIAPNDEQDIAFYAIFNDAIKFVPTMVIRAAEVFVKASPVEDYDDKSQTRLLIRGRNDWDGDALSLRYFITPEDPDILRFTRNVLNQHKAEVAAVDKQLEKFRSAEILFNEFASRLSYVNDPRDSKDRVQFPSETLALRGGDCDDMTVCFSSLLASVGVSTAFIDVIPPQRVQDAHIYLMLDTEIPAAESSLISDNPKRFVIRKNDQGVETVWVPLETTAITEGFQKAWEVGAREYLDDVELKLGVVRGWVRVVDVLPR
jgi:hypothetical protein